MCQAKSDKRLPGRNALAPALSIWGGKCASSSRRMRYRHDHVTASRDEKRAPRHTRRRQV
eukprot:scaffold21055_cov122-Isochrysis_galbana.AAC.4